jgi:hypothetical protein
LDIHKNETIETINDNLIFHTITMISCVNYNPKFLKLRKWIQIDKVHWDALSKNPNAIHILEKNLDKVDWEWLSSNPNAIHILEKNLDKVDWDGLSLNPNAIHILEKNLDKVDWYRLSRNPNIFEYDYKEIKNTLYNDNGFVEELMMNRFHPSNMDKWYDWGFDDIMGIEHE